MQNDLFSKPAEYTIDSSSLMEIFNDTPWKSKTINPGLWERVLELIKSGVIISHAEVLSEIKKDGTKGEELYNWAQANSTIFKIHDEFKEGLVIKKMSEKYKNFVNQKIDNVYADPWLIAQAKNCGIKIITEENKTGSPNPDKFRIPNICADPLFNVGCINLWELIKERGWTFKSV